jgi:hypothetical protein
MRYVPEYSACVAVRFEYNGNLRGDVASKPRKGGLEMTLRMHRSPTAALRRSLLVCGLALVFVFAAVTMAGAAWVHEAGVPYAPYTAAAAEYAPYVAGPVVHTEPYAPYVAGPVVHATPFAAYTEKPYAPYTAGPVVRETPFAAYPEKPYAPYTAGPVVREVKPGPLPRELTR